MSIEGKQPAIRLLNPGFNSVYDSQRCERFLKCRENTPASKWASSSIRRLAEASIALLALIALLPLMLIIAGLIRLTSKGPALFAQQREGLNAQLFWIYKFRTMETCDKMGPSPTHTGENDPRITRLGRQLRQMKLDELPQLYNVVMGHMSIVGPRPKLPQHTEIRNMPYRPGLTGRATLVFREEEKLLGAIEANRLESFYESRVRPMKEELDRCYMCKANFLSDFWIVVATAFSIIAPGRRLTLPQHTGGCLKLIDTNCVNSDLPQIGRRAS